MQPPRKSPELHYSPNPVHPLFAEHYLAQARPRFMSDLTIESTVSRAFGVDNFSLMPIDTPLGKHSYSLLCFSVNRATCILAGP